MWWSSYSFYLALTLDDCIHCIPKKFDLLCIFLCSLFFFFWILFTRLGQGAPYLSYGVLLKTTRTFSYSTILRIFDGPSRSCLRTRGYFSLSFSFYALLSKRSILLIIRRNFLFHELQVSSSTFFSRLDLSESIPTLVYCREKTKYLYQFSQTIKKQFVPECWFLKSILFFDQCGYLSKL